MTKLASRLVAEGLERMTEKSKEERCLLAEDPSRYDPPERRSQ